MRTQEQSFSRRRFVAVALIAAAGIPAFDQVDDKAAVLKHLKTSREFTLKVADQMPEASYDFKLTPPQMSFADQMVHLSQAMGYFVTSPQGQKPSVAKPASINRKDVISFMQKSFDSAIDGISKLTPDQLA